MPKVKWNRLVGGIALLSGITLAQSIVPVPEDSMLRRAIFDAGHVLLFGVVALLALFTLQSSVAWHGRQRLLGYVLAFVSVVALGVCTEFLQTFVARDAGLGDFGRDLLGGGAALLGALAFDRRVWSVPVILRSLVVAGAVALALVGMAETVSVWLDYQRRDAAFPLLCGFDDPWETRFVRGQHVPLIRVTPPAEWEAAHGLVGRAEFGRASFPGVWLSEPYPDWTGFDALEFDLFCDATVRLYLRVHDAHHNQRYGDRFNLALDLAPGAQRIRIPLDEIGQGPGHRILDLQEVRGVALFVEDVEIPFTLWLDGFQLTRSGAVR